MLWIVLVEAKRLVVALSLDVTGDGYVADGKKKSIVTWRLLGGKFKETKDARSTEDMTTC